MHKIYILLLTLFSIWTEAYSQGTYKLWGMTPYGGQDDLGTIFSLNGQGRNLQKHADFTTDTPGSYPVYTQLSEYQGKFYGMTSGGGPESGGILFEWDPSTNTYLRKHDFRYADGISPKGSLTLLNGKFYGMTSGGGTFGDGVIFEWDPVSNIYSMKQEFHSSDKGGGPSGSLTLQNGKFYGMTAAGGSNNGGVIFEWEPSGNIYTVKQNLNYATGSGPYGDLTVKDGVFFGMTSWGGGSGNGVIFKWELSGNSYTVRQEFDGAEKGGYAYGNLTLFGDKFYGMTSGGGTSYGGVLFEWDPTGNNFVVRQNLSANGTSPSGNLFLKDNKFYGMTSSGGAQSGGVIFEWEPIGNTYVKKIDLVADNGASPKGTLVLLNGKFYGMTYSGGPHSKGVIFEWDPVLNVYTKKQEFNSYRGAYPYADLTYHAGKLYGTTARGGTTDNGTIFETDPSVPVITLKQNLTQPNGSFPNGSLTLKGDKFYGTTVSGGPSYAGVLFEWIPGSNMYSKKQDMEYTSKGLSSRSTLSLLNGKLYATAQGGASGSGTIFEWEPDANEFAKKQDFSTLVKGSDPNSKLTIFNGKFYGTTVSGGTQSVGTIFEWDPGAGNVFTKKQDLTYASGASPKGNMVLLADMFYGMTQSGGLYNSGVIFQWDPVGNVYTKRYDFASTSGSSPAGDLVLNNGKFYGMTQYGGGAFSLGTIFEWDPVSGNFTNTVEFDGTNGRFPVYNSLVKIPAPVSSGTTGSCLSLAQITIDGSNSAKWVQVTDVLGNAVAEINANGNLLGNVNVSLFVRDGAPREDASGHLYLNRNVTITPQNTVLNPGTKVDVRLYIGNSELNNLVSAQNSSGISSGVQSIDDLALFKSASNTCSSALQPNGAISYTVEPWNSDFVFSTSLTSFSTFYFGPKQNALPVKLAAFNSTLNAEDGLLNWVTSEQFNVSHFEIERAWDGKSFVTLGSINADSKNDKGSYSFRDKNVTEQSIDDLVYYRLKMIDLDGTYSYSRITNLKLPPSAAFASIYPNPVWNQLNVKLKKSEAESWQISDISGRTIFDGQILTQNFSIPIRKLSPGAYFLQLHSAATSKIIRFVKE